MKSMKQCITDFFARTVADSSPKNELAVRYLREAVLEFLDNPMDETADNVYNSFFDGFRMRTDEFAFFDILDALRTYEKQTAGLTESQRDHFVHSVWTFLLGLGIYAENKNYREATKTDSYDFLYLWGLVSLLHDIGYPIEIAFNQIKQYLECMVDIDNDDSKPGLYFEFDNMDELIYMSDSHDESFINLLAENIALALDMDPVEIADEIRAYPNIKGKTGYIDHGFYSAIMMMRWNGLLMKKVNMSDYTFEKDIVNAATAILLHNYYKRPLQKTHKLPPLKVRQHPLAFLIILCDELQEWDRTAYGKKSKTKPLAKKCDIHISETKMTVNYGISVIEGTSDTAEKYTQSKVKTLTELLSLKDIYSELEPDFVSTVIIEEIQKKTSPDFRIFSSRPTLEELEKVAKIIHENYRRKNPDTTNGKLTWDECDYHFRYDNLSQARHLFSFVTDNGYIVLNRDSKYGLNEVNDVDSRIIEKFAKDEHDRWVKGKLADGWRYAKVRDDSKKLHPSLVPYNELTESEKDKDRAPLIEFIDTLRGINKTLYAD